MNNRNLYKANLVYENSNYHSHASKPRDSQFTFPENNSASTGFQGKIAI